MGKLRLILIAIAVAAVVGATGFGVVKYRFQKSALTNGGPALVAAVAAPVDSKIPADLSTIGTTTTTVLATTTPSTTAVIAPTKKRNDGTTSIPKVALPAPAAAPAPAPNPTPTPASANVVPNNRAPIAGRLADQNALANEAVAIVCINPITAGRVGTINYGTGIMVNKNGYVLTNEHVIENSAVCYMGRSRAVPQYFQARVAAPTIALYYSLKLVGKGIGVTDPSDNTKTSSLHDFAILKIDAKMPRSEWQSDQAPPEIRTLNETFIPWATDAEYAQFSPGGVFPAININFDYQPVRGDFLSMGGYIADSGIPDYTFTDGNLSVFSTTTISVSMPTGQGLSGSPIVDSQGNLVALNFAMDCGQWQGCYAWDNQYDIGFSSFTYGNQALALTIPFIDQGMKQDLGFGLKELMTMN